MISFDAGNFVSGAVHDPIFVEEVMSFIKREYRVFVDATTGEGGHSIKFLENIGNGICLICIDLDREILLKASQRINRFKKNNIYFINDNYKNIPDILKKLGYKKADFILADLGISSYHYFESGRGFSFNDETAVDLRLDTTAGLPFIKILPGLKQDEIADILFRYADERHARRIAAALYLNRNTISTAKELSDLVQNVLKGHYRGKLHPATKTFMALRIYMNEELRNLKDFLDIIPSVLNPGGRLAIISFHSVEDRIAKEYFKNYSHREKTNKYKPGDSVTVPLGINLTKKPIKPSTGEILSNPRARSAKLRVFERI